MAHLSKKNPVIYWLTGTEALSSAMRRGGAAFAGIAGNVDQCAGILKVNVNTNIMTRLHGTASQDAGIGS